MSVDIFNVTTPDDSCIINKTNMPVIVACHEIRGDFTINLQPGETKIITYDFDANAYPAAGAYSYDNLKYAIGKRQTWEVRKVGFFANLFKKEKDELIMVSTTK